MMAEVLSAVVISIVDQGREARTTPGGCVTPGSCSVKYIKKLTRKNDVEDALQKLDRLTDQVALTRNTLITGGWAAWCVGYFVQNVGNKDPRCR